MQSGQAVGLETLRAFLSRADAFGFGFCEFWAVREVIYLETEVRCRTADGNLRQITCYVIARTTHGIVHDLRFYLDPAPISGFLQPLGS